MRPTIVVYHRRDLLNRRLRDSVATSPIGRRRIRNLRLTFPAVSFPCLDQVGYRLTLAANQPGSVCFVLSRVGRV